ncbi:hypothetical protein BgiMline_025429, partial [Biomphalaria glabrata]
TEGKNKVDKSSHQKTPRSCLDILNMDSKSLISFYIIVYLVNLIAGNDVILF